jgi:tetratricopeptide (TPR) repeat protein
MSPISALRAMWDDADSKDEKEKVKEIVFETLEKQFDADMNQREAELERVEARIKHLREQLSERRRSRDEVVELKVKEIVMDWKGLGWATTGNSNGNKSRFTLKGLASKKKQKMDAHMATNLYTQAMLTKNDRLADYVGDKMSGLGESSSINEVNSILWETWEQYGSKIDSKKYWETLAEFGDKAIKKHEPKGQMLGLIEDTVAHLYYEAGDMDRAMELQEQAIEHVDNSDVKDFFEKLKKEMEE